MAVSKPTHGELALAALTVFVRGVVEAGQVALAFVETATRVSSPRETPALQVVPDELARKRAEATLRRLGKIR